MHAKDLKYPHKWVLNEIENFPWSMETSLDFYSQIKLQGINWLPSDANFLMSSQKHLALIVWEPSMTLPDSFWEIGRKTGKESEKKVKGNWYTKIGQTLLLDCWLGWPVILKTIFKVASVMSDSLGHQKVNVKQQKPRLLSFLCLLCHLVPKPAVAFSSSLSVH